MGLVAGKLAHGQGVYEEGTVLHAHFGPTFGPLAAETWPVGRVTRHCNQTVIRFLKGEAGANVSFKKAVNINRYTRVSFSPMMFSTLTKCSSPAGNL